MKDKIKVMTAGGTIDKVYFDANSLFEVGEPQIPHILSEANISFDYDLESVLKKDSLEITDEDRQTIFDKVASSHHRRILITHGTDTMVTTAQTLLPIPDKVIVFTGAMEPAKIKSSDAVFNVGCAITAVQLLTAGVYIVMNGLIFNASKVTKNLTNRRFEAISDCGIISAQV